MPGHEPTHRGRPVQVAKRKQKPLGKEEMVVGKKLKTKKTAATKDDEASDALDDQEELKMFISPEKYLGKARIGDGDEEPRVFVSPLKYMHAANEDDGRLRGGRESLEKKQRGKESGDRHSVGKAGSSQQQVHVEKPAELPVDRFVTSAQEDLMQMINEGVSDKAIANQMKIIKMLRARLPPQDEPRSSSAQNQLPKKNIQDDGQTQAPNKEVSEPSMPSKPASTPRHPMSISSDSSSSSPYSPPTPSPAPTKSTKRISTAQAKTSLKNKPSLTPSQLSSKPLIKESIAKTKAKTFRESNPSPTPAPTSSPAPSKLQTRTSITKAKAIRETKELLKAARPASAPTSLPAAQRTNKSLTPTEVAKLSKVHTTFDEKETNKFDRHTRKINSTKGMASDRPVMPERGLESRIRAPTESPEPEEESSGNGLCLDAENLRAAAAAASVERGQSFSAGGFTSVNQTGKGKLNPSLRELEASDRTINPLPTARHVPSGRTVAAAVRGQNGRGRQGGRPGQVYNAATERWQYVEEVDSDND